MREASKRGGHAKKRSFKYGVCSVPLKINSVKRKAEYVKNCVFLRVTLNISSISDETVGGMG